MKYLILLLFLCACNEGYKIPEKKLPANIQEAKAAAQTPLPGPPVGPWACQLVNIIAPGMVIKLHGPSGEFVTNGRLLIQPGATIWISVDKPCVWDGVDFSDYVDATYTQRGSIEPTITIHAYPAAGG